MSLTWGVGVGFDSFVPQVWGAACLQRLGVGGQGGRWVAHQLTTRFTGDMPEGQAQELLAADPIAP